MDGGGRERVQRGEGGRRGRGGEGRGEERGGKGIEWMGVRVKGVKDLTGEENGCSWQTSAHCTHNFNHYKCQTHQDRCSGVSKEDNSSFDVALLISSKPQHTPIDVKEDEHHQRKSCRDKRQKNQPLSKQDCIHNIRPSRGSYTAKRLFHSCPVRGICNKNKKAMLSIASCHHQQPNTLDILKGMYALGYLCNS